MTPSPNTHPLLTKLFPRDEVLGGVEVTSDIPGSERGVGAGLLTQRYTSWHSHKSPSITNSRIIGKETISGKPSGEDGIVEWELYTKCYSEARV